MDRIIDAPVRWHILKRNAQWATLVVCVLWGLTLVAFILDLFGLVVVRRGRVLTPEGFAIAALAFTILSSLYVAKWFCTAVVLARRGVQAKGTVRKVGGVKDFRPWRRLDFSFTYQDRPYKKSIWGGLGAYDLGSSLQVIVDPNKPIRCMFREDVFPPGYSLELGHAVAKPDRDTGGEVGYDIAEHEVHIERNDGSEISLEDWRDAARNTQGVRIATNVVLVRNPATHEKLWASPSPGDIEVYFPDEDAWHHCIGSSLEASQQRISFASPVDIDDPQSPIRRALINIAQQLDAKLVDDSGEIFT